jgi:hypothetical protein
VQKARLAKKCEIDFCRDSEKEHANKKTALNRGVVDNGVSVRARHLALRRKEVHSS